MRTGTDARHGQVFAGALRDHGSLSEATASTGTSFRKLTRGVRRTFGPVLENHSTVLLKHRALFLSRDRRYIRLVARDGGRHHFYKEVAMVREVRVDQVRDAREEMEDYLQQVMEDDAFPDDFAELQCALVYLEECGVAWPEVGRMTVEDILERYRRYLREDVP